MFILSLYSIDGFSNEVTIALNEFCPYHCVNSNGKWDENQPGYVYEMYNEIFTKAGYKFKPTQMHFHRGLLAAGEGGVDAISGPIKITSKKELVQKIKTNKFTGKVYEKLIYSAEPISLYHSSCFYGKKTLNWTFQEVDSLNGLLLASIKDFDYGDILNRYVEKNKGNDRKTHIVHGNRIAERTLRMLTKGRVDLVLLDKNVGLYTLKNLKDKSIDLLECTGEGKRFLYLGFSPVNLERSLKLVKIFDEGLRDLRSAGKLQKILGKYGLEDWMEAE